MTKRLVDEPFSLGLDNYSLKQSSSLGDDLTRNDSIERLEIKFDHIQARLDRILILMESILNEMQKM